MGIHVKCDASGPIGETDRLIKGPETDIFEGIMLATYAMVDAKVHELTGRLKASGVSHSERDEGMWTGTVSFARYPGIYELARGDSPTQNHPEGGHHFFEPAYDFSPPAMKSALMDFVSDGESQDDK
jgi:hypothetical protein